MAPVTPAFDGKISICRDFEDAELEAMAAEKSVS